MKPKHAAKLSRLNSETEVAAATPLSMKSRRALRDAANTISALQERWSREDETSPPTQGRFQMRDPASQMSTKIQVAWDCCFPYGFSIACLHDGKSSLSQKPNHDAPPDWNRAIKIVRDTSGNERALTNLKCTTSWR
jgi:hypothetical protein